MGLESDGVDKVMKAGTEGYTNRAEGRKKGGIQAMESLLATRPQKSPFSPLLVRNKKLISVI